MLNKSKKRSESKLSLLFKETRVIKDNASKNLKGTVAHVNHQLCSFQVFLHHNSFLNVDTVFDRKK